MRAPAVQCDGRWRDCRRFLRGTAASRRAPLNPRVWWHCNRNKWRASPWENFKRESEGIRASGFRKTILSPGIGCIRVAAQFPETEDVSIQKGDLTDELSPFPGISF